jgi:hypothetical protein
MLRRVALVSTNVAEELSATFIRVTNGITSQKTPFLKNNEITNFLKNVRACLPRDWCHKAEEHNLEM